MTTSRIEKVTALSMNSQDQQFDNQMEDHTPDFPIDKLAPAMSALGKELDRVYHIPSEIIGSSLLGFISSSIGNGLGVRSLPNRETPPNLYVLAVGESGTGKSEAFRVISKPFIDYDKERYDKWVHDQLPALLAEKSLIEAELGRVKKKQNRKHSLGDMERDDNVREVTKLQSRLHEIEKKLVAPRLFVEDVTSQKLAVMLEAEGEQIASLTPDAGAAINVLFGQYNNLKRVEDSLHVKSWSRDPCRVDRKGSPPVILNKPCLSILWMIQPDKLEDMLDKKPLMDGGLMQRFLIAEAKAVTYQNIDRNRAAVSEEAVKGWEELVVGLIETFRLAQTPVVIDPPASVCAIMDEYCNEVGRQADEEFNDIRSFVVRWGEQAWRVLTVLHAAHHGRDAGSRPILDQTAHDAIEILRWFGLQQLRMLDHNRESVRASKIDKILSLAAKKRINGIASRDVQRARIVSKAEEAHKLLDEMCASQLLTKRENKPDNGGDTKVRYYSNMKFEL